MLRLLRLNVRKFSSDPPRRQNFFELNPIFPDQGQKDFDIYNTDYKHIPVATLTQNDNNRTQSVKQKLIKQVYMNPVYELIRKRDSQDREIDEEWGFPIGMHEDFDSFIERFKREKKVGSNVVGQFEGLVMKLMGKFNAKSEIELMKIFRLNLANMKKDSLKDKIRGLVINSAFIEHLKQMKAKGIDKQSLTIEELERFSAMQHENVKRSGQDISQDELRQIVTRNTLDMLDEKIKKAEQELLEKAVADGTYIPSFHPKFGEAIQEDVNVNLDYDLNFPRGHMSMVKTSHPLDHLQDQDQYLEARINKLFFTQALKQLQQLKEIEPQKMEILQNIPVHIRQKDKIINQMLYKYKEEDLLIEPDLEDIYRDVDIVLKKIAVKVVPNYLDNQLQNKQGIVKDGSEVKERIISKDLLLWRTLDAEEIFQPDHYVEEKVNKEIVEEKSLGEVSPSSVLELSLNKMPFNLYRHADLDQFSVFTKYKKKIYRDYLKDQIIDPELEFKYFSLDQARIKLQKIKRPEEIPDKFYGYARRKKSEAEVFVTPGNGKVMINKEPLADYFGDVYHRGECLKPLIFTETAGKWDLQFNVVGGGQHGQSECMAMALTKALIMVNPKYEKILAGFGLVGTDDRRRQPKRIGLYSARVRPPYVRR